LTYFLSIIEKEFRIFWMFKREVSMSKEKVTIKNNTENALSRLLNKVDVEKPKSNLDDILEDIAEICSETNEDYSQSESTPTKKI
jgi:hypothetical protein